MEFCQSWKGEQVSVSLRTNSLSLVTLLDVENLFEKENLVQNRIWFTSHVGDYRYNALRSNSDINWISKDNYILRALSPSILHTHRFAQRLCMCVCVCEREREREGEWKRKSYPQTSIHSDILTLIHTYLFTEARVNSYRHVQPYTKLFKQSSFHTRQSRNIKDSLSIQA